MADSGSRIRRREGVRGRVFGDLVNSFRLRAGCVRIAPAVGRAPAGGRKPKGNLGFRGFPGRGRTPRIRNPSNIVAYFVNYFLGILVKLCY